MDLAGKWIGTKVWENRWRDRALAPVDGPSPVNPEHVHRQWFIDSFSRFEPLSRILDFGCGYGATAQVIAERYPEVVIHGIDLSRPSIEEGKRRMKDLGLADRVTLEVGSTDTLEGLDPDGYDIVVCGGVLLYIGPDKIENTAVQLGRVASKGLAMMEFHHAGYGPLGRHSRDGWIRDYDALFRGTISPRDVVVTKVPEEIWPTGRWPQYGYRVLVEV